MPGMNRIYQSTRGAGLAVVGVDENERAEDAAAYLARHRYAWTNLHDKGGALKKAMKSEGIPLVVLVDAQGKIVYYDFGGDEAALCKAIASLGPEFASLAASQDAAAKH
jgi:hypothetical protein